MLPVVSFMTSSATVAVVSGGTVYDLFDVLEIAEGVARVRSPYLFEIGEELAVRVEHAGETYEAQARVRAHVGDAEQRITELELQRGAR